MQTVTFKDISLSYEINEEIKHLRTNVQFSGADKKVILMTSVQAAEGKSTVSLELAVSLTELGKRVLLLDTDMRKSMLISRVLRSDRKESGLSHLLAGQDSMENCFCQTNIKGLYVVFAGRVPPNPAELLAGTRMDRLLEWARENFDYTIVDCPPLGIVTDAAVLAPKCDGAIMVIKADTIPGKAAQSVLRELERTGVPVLGVVLNQVTRLGKSGYYKKYGYYGDSEA